ncbi:MAG: HD domain-containing protein [Paludibacteraceae bacterium]|nr:HD domain-containing protein [Paludibacteraceae bacterium]
MDYKQEFLRLLRSTEREDIDYLVEDLEDLGFFLAPASTRFHLNTEGGLVEHSVNVCNIALRLRESMIEMDDTLREKLPKDGVIIASLLHDVCKADIYKKVMKKSKNGFGVWTDVPGYEVDYSSFPLGHGEKSVIVVLRSGFDLTDDEIMAIRWHMTAWDLPFQSPEARGNLNEAKDVCPLLSLIQAADNLAANLIERNM